ncbi:MAG TPA: hypothetical protein VF828_02245, partial [Patescibacteria group bacterium]
MCTLQKLFIITAFVCFLGIFTPKSILASDNIFGLHLTQTSDIGNASKIINSSGGDWGWVTIVIRTDQLDRNAWQEFFDNCRKFHLIPIIRLSTLMQNDSWKRPEYSDIDTLAGFLNSLNWPSIQQHIVLFNEINHASEWGGAVDIKDYTDKAIYAAKKFKSLNPNFYILSSPLDLASPENPPQFKDAGNVYREIYLYNPDYFDQIDALASHSYPNHGFIGKPTDDGQHSIHGYQWELDDIRSLGVQKTYPVFITETGWPHREGETKANQFYTVTTAAQFLSYSLQNWGKDKRIQAVTPFIYNYPHAPFDHFSWLDLNENLYPEYQQIIQTPKLKNSIEQITKYEPVNIHIPYFLLPDTDYSGQIILKNTGQSVWGETQFCLNPQM